MGYYMEQSECEFFIPAENKEAALQAIKNLAGKETITDSSGPHFSWVDTSEFLAANSLADALSAWRWDLEEDSNGNIDYIQFSGEKAGDDEIVFAAIAPFVKKGSYIEMRGEDGAIWRWAFNGETCKEIHPRIEWDE